MKKEEATKIHKRTVLILHAVLWGVALALSLVTYEQYLNDDKVLVKLCVAFVVFNIFIWESAINFLDLKAVHCDKNFKGELLGINARLFLIIPLSFFLGVLYYAINNWLILFVLTLAMMVWLKYELVSFTNCIEDYYVKTKPTFSPKP